MAATPITAILAPQRGQGVAEPAAQAADLTNGNTFNNDGRELVKIVNGGGASATVTIAQTQVVDGVATSGLPIVVPAGATRWTAHLPPSSYGNAPVITAPGGSTISYVVLQLPPGV